MPRSRNSGWKLSRKFILWKNWHIFQGSKRTYLKITGKNWLLTWDVTPNEQMPNGIVDWVEDHLQFVSVTIIVIPICNLFAVLFCLFTCENLSYKKNAKGTLYHPLKSTCLVRVTLFRTHNSYLTPWAIKAFGRESVCLSKLSCRPNCIARHKYFLVVNQKQFDKHSILIPGVSSNLPEWGKFQAGWDMWYQLPCSHPQTWGKFLPWRKAGWWQSQLQHPPSPLGVWDPLHSSLPQGGLWDILHTENYLNRRSFKWNSAQNLQTNMEGQNIPATQMSK